MAASLDRFLTRAIIALAFLIIGLVGGYVLASRFPGIVPVEPAKPTVASKDAQPEPAPEPKPEAKTETPEPEPEPGTETGGGETGGGETDGGETGGGETGGGETGGGETGGGEEVDPGPPPPLTGKFVIEIRDLAGATRTKADVRDLAATHSHEIEACIVQHEEGALKVARLHYQLAVNAGGDVVENLVLQGVEPTVDACVAKAIATWNFGPTTESSFFKLKFVWTA